MRSTSEATNKLNGVITRVIQEWGSGKYVVIIDLDRQGRIIVMNKVPDSANMIFQLFRKG